VQIETKRLRNVGDERDPRRKELLAGFEEERSDDKIAGN
jgi:hypothetical protein